jgi:hypothetical protein
VSDLLVAAATYFAEQGWPVAQHDSLPVLRLEYEGAHGTWPCFVKIDEARRQVSVISVLPDTVAAEYRTEVAVFLTRANYLVPLGHFDMDFSDGEVRFRATVNVSQASFTSGLLDPLVKTNWVVVDQHLPELRAVASGERNAEDAMSRIIDDSGNIDFDFTR